MNAKKQKEKERRRAHKLADEAWQALDDGDPVLAEKLIRRATATQPDNPRLWNDQGVILDRRGDEPGADRAFRYAIRLARDFAEPYHHLAALRARKDRYDDASALEGDAVRLAPQNTTYAAQLEAYRAEAERRRQETLAKLPWMAEEAPAPPPAEDLAVVAAVAAAAETFVGPLGRFPWDVLDDRLTREGYTVLPGLLEPAFCAELREWFDDDRLFDRTVVLDRPESGAGTCRYFRNPLPPVVDGLRRAAYAHAARVANAWRRLLGKPESYPPEWAAFRDECRREGQARSAVQLLRYGPGGFHALHRDLRGRVVLPVQLAVVLSPRADQEAGGVAGGEFVLCDVPEGPKARRRAITAGLGDGLLFAARDRLVGVGGAYGLQKVRHGTERVTAGTLFVLNVPFHEHR
jgi:uncharacterized protein